MNKKYFVLFLVMMFTTNITQLSFCMEEKEETEIPEITSEKPIRNFTVNLESIIDPLQTLNENFKQFNKVSKPSFFQQRIHDAQKLMSTIIINGSYTLFENLCLKKVINAIDDRFFATQEDILIQKHNKNATNITVHKGNLKLILGEMKDIQEELKLTKNPKKRALLLEEYRELNRARKTLNKEHQEWRKKFTGDILQHKAYKAKQPKTIFENQSEELKQIQGSINSNSTLPQSTPSNDGESSLATIEADDDFLNDASKKEKIDEIFNQSSQETVLEPQNKELTEKPSQKEDDITVAQEKIDEIFDHPQQEEVLKAQNEPIENPSNSTMLEQEADNNNEEPQLLFKPAVE